MEDENTSRDSLWLILAGIAVFFLIIILVEIHFSKKEEKKGGKDGTEQGKNK